MDLLGNAVEAIRAGVEDYEVGTAGRLLAAVRNIHSGVLLLFKEALRRASPPGSKEALLKATIVPRKTASGAIEFMGQGRKTATVNQIRQRFQALGITADWQRFASITDQRNDIEHYFSTANKKALESILANAFLIVRDFLDKELGELPLELLGDSTWQTMLKVSEVYGAERAQCKYMLAAVAWGSGTLAEGIADVRCPSCSGTLLRPEPGDTEFDYDMRLECRGCGGSLAAEQFVPSAVASARSWDMYLVQDDGAELPYVQCPECGADCYVLDEGRCALCGHEAEHECARCGSSIPPGELGCSPLCGWCAHMEAKDD